MDIQREEELVRRLQQRDERAFVECVRKRLNLQHDEALRAAREERPVRTYTLWVLCAGDPVTLRATLRLRRAKGWPRPLPGVKPRRSNSGRRAPRRPAHSRPAR